jgi:SAM-dependent methyltransferase
MQATSNSWDERYGADTYFYGVEPNDFLREQAGALRARGEALCLGEGEGRNAVHLAQQGFAVVAVDQSAVGMQKAQQLAAARGVRITTVISDLAKFRIEPGSWDAIVSIWCHLPRELRREVHRQAAAGLKPGGAFLLEAYTPAQLQHRTGGPSTPDLMPTLAELREELAGLDFRHGVECERIVQEGTGHRGLSAVVQVLAFRRE